VYGTNKNLDPWRCHSVVALSRCLVATRPCVRHRIVKRPNLWRERQGTIWLGTPRGILARTGSYIGSWGNEKKWIASNNSHQPRSGVGNWRLWEPRVACSEPEMVLDQTSFVLLFYIDTYYSFQFMYRVRGDARDEDLERERTRNFRRWVTGRKGTSLLFLRKFPPSLRLGDAGMCTLSVTLRGVNSAMTIPSGNGSKFSSSLTPFKITKSRS
jgi:hypothetical protein